ncbi:MAG TPA: GtrA family protein [Candidatus Scatosoma pullicola]|nr:GtrA family protein [Candidatus Scatosoma pullicola]
MEKSPERSGAPCGAEPREEGTEEQNGKQSGKSLFFEIVRFLIVGGTATLVDYAVSYLLYRWLLPPGSIGGTPSLVLSTAAGFCVGLAVNWVLSVLFVFRNVKDKKKSRSGVSFLKFALIGAVGLGITELGMHLGVSRLPEIVLFGSATFLSESWTWWIMKVTMTCIVLVWNYIGRKLFIFR